MSAISVDATAVNAGRSDGSTVSEIDNSAIGITMDNGEAKVTSGLQDTGSPTSVTYDSSQSGVPNLALSDENKEQPSEMVFTVVTVNNDISELIQSSFNEVGLPKGVQLSLVPATAEDITSTINADEVQLTATQNSASFNQLALITTTLQQSSQGEERQQFLGQKNDGVKLDTFDVSSIEMLNDDHQINKAENKIDGVPQKKARVSCSICDQNFSDLPSMRRHQLIHSEQKPFQCEFCEKAFRRKDNLREHRNIHTLENVYSCAHCGKTFPRKYTHKVHMARFCTKEKCSDSGKDEVMTWGPSETATKITHISPTNKASSTKTSVSNNKSSDPCHICHKTFRDSSTLKRHLLTHSDERPYKCSQCNKSFRRKDHLQEHVIVHNEVRPFPCPQCGKSFSRKNGLKTHMIRTSHGSGSTDLLSNAVMLSDNEELTEAQGNSHEFQEMLTSNQVFARNSNAKKQGDMAKVTEQSEQSKDLVQTNVEMKINEEGNISVNLDISEVNINLNSQNPGGTSSVNSGNVPTINGLIKQTETSVVLSSKDVETLNVDENGGSVSSNKEENVSQKSSTRLSDSQNEKVSEEVQENQTGTTIEDILRCPNCPHVFFKKDQLWNHFQGHLTNDMLACEHCLATFTETEVFEEHQKKCVATINKDTYTQSFHGVTGRPGSHSEGVVSGDTYLEDELCQGPSNDNPVEDLTSKGLRVCPICNKQFRDTTALRRHSLVHSGERPHACKQCDKRFRRRDHLKSHVTAYHCNTTTFNCNICEMVFNTRYSLSIHSKSCKKAVTLPQAMTVDDATKTTDVTKIDDTAESKSCPVCHKTFKDPSTQRRHLRVHSEERPFQCDVCPKSFRRKDNLKEHMLCHSDQKPFACEDCGKALSRRSSLTNHRVICPMRRMDTTAITIGNATNMPEMDFVEPSTTTEDREMCADNNTQETPAEPMEEDIQELDGGGGGGGDGGDGDHGDGDHDDDEEDHGSDDGGDDKGFSCNQCGKAFRAKWTLKYHQRVHTGEKPYTCLTCDRQFRQPSHLKIHERTHSGERPYVCEACGRAFIDSSTMRRHARLHKDTAGAVDPDEVIHDDSGGSEGTGVHHSEGLPVERDCIPMAVSSGDESVKSSQPISTNVLGLVHVGGMALSSKIETLSDINWQQNPQGNLEEHMVYLFPTAKETNKEQCPNTSENISFE